MANRIPQETIDRIREATDIVAFISQYLPLKRAGKYFKALCPFHNETSPSFFVSAEKQIYHCFGCGAGGNVFTFLMEHEKVSFPEALRTLATRAGIELPRREEGRGRYDQLYEANEFASRTYHRILKEGGNGKGARDYLLGRAVDEGTRDTFRLGFAPKSWDLLLKKAAQGSITKATLKVAGLVRQGDGGYYDYFRNRIIFPIFNLSGRVIGFGGRVLDDSLPKYLNSPDSPIYKKRESLYGLCQAKSEIRRCEEAIVVEGYTDLLTLHQFGFKNAVASLGTALTESQAGLLARYASRVSLTYDPDPSGREAALRGGDLLLQAGLGVKVLSLPAGQDPDLFLRKRGRGEFEKLLDQAEDYLDFKLRHLCSVHDLSSLDGKVAVTKDMASSLAKIRDEVRRSLSVQKVAGNLDIGEEVLLAAFPRRQKKGDEGSQFFLPRETPRRSELQLIGLMLREGEIVSLVRDRLDPEDLSSPRSKELLELLYGAEDEGKGVDSASLLGSLADEERKVISEILFWEPADVDLERMAMDLIAKIRGTQIESKMGELKKEIEEAEKRGEPHQHLLREYQELAQERIR